MPNQCFVCRNRNQENGVPCERDEEGICGFTSHPADEAEEKEDDENINKHIMKHGNFINLIASMWMDIILISQKETIHKTKNKQIVEFKIYTLEHLDAYLKRQYWEDMIVNEKDAFYFITLFHKTYIQSLLETI